MRPPALRANASVKKTAALAARETETKKFRHGISALVLNTILADAVRRGAQFMRWRVRDYDHMPGTSRYNHPPSRERARLCVNGAHGVGGCNIATVNCARAIAELRYCESDRKRQSLLRSMNGR